MRVVFCLAACACVLAVALICAFLFANGLPFFGKVNALDFLLGEKWKPTNDIYGILPMILGSLYITAGAVLFGAPIAVLTSVYMAYFAPKPVLRVLEPAVSLLAGIPSVIYGLVWADAAGALRARNLRRQGLLHPHRQSAAGHDDPAYHYQRGGVLPAAGAHELLRGQPCAGRNGGAQRVPRHASGGILRCDLGDCVGRGPCHR